MGYKTIKVLFIWSLIYPLTLMNVYSEPPVEKLKELEFKQDVQLEMSMNIRVLSDCEFTYLMSEDDKGNIPEKPSHKLLEIGFKPYKNKYLNQGYYYFAIKEIGKRHSKISAIGLKIPVKDFSIATEVKCLKNDCSIGNYIEGTNPKDIGSWVKLE